MAFLKDSTSKSKVIFIMGATGTGKSRLSLDLAAAIEHAEIINADKMQVYDGLEIVTNKISDSDKQQVPHHLLGGIDPETDYTAEDFCDDAMAALKAIHRRGRVAIIVGGSNSFIEALVMDPRFNSAGFDCCFLWLDVSLLVLFTTVCHRVNEMVDAGLVDEVREIYVPDADYSRGVRRSIGIPELDRYFREEKTLDEANKQRLLESAIEEIKENTCKLVLRQVEKIRRLKNQQRWPIHQFNATRVFMERERREDALNELVVQPCLEVVKQFLLPEPSQAVAAAAAHHSGPMNPMTATPARDALSV